MLRGLAEQGDVEQVGLAGIGEGRLRGRDFGRNEVSLHRIGVNAVIQLGQRAIEVPGEGKAATFVVLEPLEFLDEVEFELHGHPRGKLKGDVLMGERATVTSSRGGDANGPGFFDPLPGGQDEAVESGPFFNPIEFDGIKIRVIELLPDAQKLDRVPIPHPVLNDVVSPFAVLVSGNIGQTDEIVLSLRQDGDGRASAIPDGRRWVGLFGVD